MQDRYFTDEELVAFLDGEDELAPVAEIARALESDEALVKRLNALSIDRDAIASAFKDLVPSEGTMPDLAAIPSRPLGYGWKALAAAAMVALAVGIGAGNWMASASRSGWTDYVAAYQALYSNSTLAHIEQTPEALQVELDRSAAAIGKSIAVEVLTVFPEADYKRSQILSFEGRALVQLAFATSTGEPLALCIIRAEAGGDQTPLIDQMEGLSTAYWAKDGYEYLLIGGTDDALVERMAAGFARAEI